MVGNRSSSGNAGSKCLPLKSGGGSGLMVHTAKLSFLQVGVFSVSACAKITGGRHHQHPGGGGGEEVWWAPVAETVVVENDM